ncbi:E3 ubiquitin-protein ligase Smurf1 isoform X2 [Phlebotomus papatasi]|uniref:E3 ubiquitin-protein ligase Smurf1 isoform X2 n=1 Tax=Phlebotomus papatasi TaxID=29031 RepID=UPI0024835E07|nr:E3 ubiquitin-protein ligase Smurf1 isoform X2 [Phlebotomus papatasi]XP_055706387.1 E3 ubiquitin-protein ligase Smurf1 isoform X2 [Phlebotomus papatasi]
MNKIEYSRRSRNGAQIIRLTILCARNLARKEFLRLPDPFAKVSVDGTGQVHSTETCRASLDPKWNSHYDLYLGIKDAITISVWNYRKIHKRHGSGFLGCVRIQAEMIQRLKDSGYQRLDLGKNAPDDQEQVKGQIIIALTSRDAQGSTPLAIVSPGGDVHGPAEDTEGQVTSVPSIQGGGGGGVPAKKAREPVEPQPELPEGWELRKTLQGRVYYVNHVTKSTQWDRPTAPATNGTVAVQVADEGTPAGPSRSATCTNLTNGVSATAEASRRHSLEVLLNLKNDPVPRDQRHISPDSVTRGSREVPQSPPQQVANGVAPIVSPSATPKCNSADILAQNRTPQNQVSRDPTTPPGSNSSQNNVNHLTSAINALVLESPSRPTLPAALSTSNSLNNNVSSSSGVTNSPASNNNVSISSPPAAVATSPINNNTGAPPPHEPETPNQGRPADPQRARRSMRSVDDSARRRSARGSRNIMTQIPGRANGVSGRPAVDLPPGYEMRTTQQGQVYFYHIPTGVSTWHDPRIPRDLDTQAIALDTLGPLPSGWEQRKTASGRVYFVDHNNRTTQFTDPRLNGHLLGLLRRQSQAPATTTSTGPPMSCTAAGAGPQVANGNVRNGEVISPTRPTVAQTGPPDLPQGLLDGAELLPKYRRDLVGKMRALRAELQALQPQSGHCRLEVSRAEIFEESYRLIMKMRPKDMRKRLMVKFRGEEGLDYGGVAREWLHLLSREMLNPQYGLFQYSRDDHYTLQINTDSAVNPDHLSYFHFVGRILGIAVFHGHCLDGGFTTPFYKQLLNKPITLSDIEGVDPELHRSLTWILENNIDGVIESTFSVENNSFGALKVHELKQGGAGIAVTEENKKEYVKLYVNYRFMRGIEQQFLALQKGFCELIPSQLLRPFDERELELVIGGISSIDVNDWKQHTRLKHCTPETQQVVWFWQIVESYTSEMRARLLQFVTGSSRVPLQGFRALQGSTGAVGPRLFTIHLTADVPTQNLPKAHTCFNRIDLPPYDTYQLMYDKLTQAVEETCGFAVE